MAKALKLTAANITGRRGIANPATQNLSKITPKTAGISGQGNLPSQTTAKLTGKPMK